MKTRTLLPLLLLLCCACVSQAQNAERGNAEATIKNRKISINYGRPALKGRDLLAKAPVGTVWRVGMNEAAAAARKPLQPQAGRTFRTSGR